MSIWFLPKARTCPAPPASEAEDRIGLPSLTLPSFERITQAGEIKALLYTHHPEYSPETIETMTQSLWQFSHEIQPEDLVLLWDDTDSNILVYEVTGPYRYEHDTQAPHGYPAHLIRSLPAEKLKHGAFFTHRARWCVAVEDSPTEIEIRDLLRAGRNIPQRLIVIGALLFIAFQLFMMWNIYWKFATTHHVID